MAKYKRASFFYDQLMKPDLSDEELFGYVEESENDEVKIGILEYRLGWHFGCLKKSLWEYYINFLKGKDNVVG